jgi:hypothetical protein
VRRAEILEAGRALEAPVDLDILGQATRAALTNASAVRPVASIDGRVLAELAGDPFA